MHHESLTIVATGANIATGAASASAAIPNNAAGSRPRYIRVAVTQPAYIKIGSGAQVATTNDILVNPNNAIILASKGCDTIAALAVGTAGACQVSPLEG